MDNQHEKIAGYRDLSQAEIDLMNECKMLAAKCGQAIEKLQNFNTNPTVPEDPMLDQRCVSLAKTNLQQGFMWMIRSIAQPTTFG